MTWCREKLTSALEQMKREYEEFIDRRVDDEPVPTKAIADAIMADG